jgi:hypothetical protein
LGPGRRFSDEIIPKNGARSSSFIVFTAFVTGSFNGSVCRVTEIGPIQYLPRDVLRLFITWVGDSAFAAYTLRHQAR